MADELFDGRRLRLLIIVDNFSRVSPFIGVAFRYKGYDVVLALKEAVAQYGVPESHPGGQRPGVYLQGS